MKYDKFFALAKEAGIQEAELYIGCSKSLSVSLFHGEVDNYSDNTGYTILARGLINGNFDSNLTSINFQLNDQIDLNNFDDNKQISKRYELKGIVSISLQLNNYVAFCKSPVNNNWYYYDSEKICPADINYILSEHDSTKNTGYIPCILVYQLVK